jgi:hypothetical protein
MGSATDIAPVVRVEGGSRAATAWQVVAAGAALGLGWGVLARGWMRLIAAVPEFSWAGTLFILGLATAAGASLAVVEVLRRRGAGRWRLLAAVPALLLFVGPGAVLAPAALFGGFALSGRGPLAARLVLGGGPALAWAFFVAWTDQSVRYSAVGGIGLVLLCLALAAGWSVVFRPGVPR